MSNPSPSATRSPFPGAGNVIICWKTNLLSVRETQFNSWAACDPSPTLLDSLPSQPPSKGEAWPAKQSSEQERSPRSPPGASEHGHYRNCM